MLTIWNRIALIFCLGLAALAALGMRFVNEDLAVALCSGRDTVHGLLGKPDRWSFTMDGSMWVDQSWLSHLLYYGSYASLGDLGPVLIKVLLLAACLGLLFARSRSLGVGLESSLIALTVGTVSLAPFLQIRAENFGLLWFLVFTTFLVAPARWGRWRYLGCLGVLAIWANSHGSFMLGIALLGLRFFVTAVCAFLPPLRGRRGKAGVPEGESHETERGEAAAWLITFLVAFGLVALLSPYGTANLEMPFRQLSASPMTSRSADWVPLLNWDQISGRRFLQPLDVKPYLVFVAATLVLAVLMAVNENTRRCFQRLALAKEKPEILMEALIPLVLFVMAVRFRRMILFAGPALVPVAAMLIQAHVSTIRSHGSEQRPDDVRRLRFLAALLLSICTLVLAQQFYVKTVRPYMPGNPMRSDRPLTSQLMSFDAYNMDVARFMADNHIEGHMLTTWTAAAFLRFSYPRIQVFMDARDQSFYSDEIIKLFFSVMHTQREDVPRTMEILDRYGVSLIALATTPMDFQLATLLMETRRWACIYKDDEFILLVRSDAERFAGMIPSAALDGLRYPSEDVKIASEAVMAQFHAGGMRPELLAKLIDLVHRKPDPDLYILIALAMNRGAPCLNAETWTFLSTEAKRLAAMDYMGPDGARKVVKSLINVAGMLANDQAACRGGADGPRWAAIRDRAGSIYQHLGETYRGY
jgi:hypothetical protein